MKFADFRRYARREEAFYLLHANQLTPTVAQGQTQQVLQSVTLSPNKTAVQVKTVTQIFIVPVSIVASSLVVGGNLQIEQPGLAGVPVAYMPNGWQAPVLIQHNG